MSDFVLSATLELKDNFTAKVQKAQSGFKDFSQSLKGLGPDVDKAASQMAKAGTAAEQLGLKATRAKAGLSGIRGVYEATIRAKDNVTATVRKAKTELSGLAGKTYTVAINVKQNMAGGGFGSGFKGKMSDMASGMLMGTSMQMAGAAGIGFGVYDAVKNYSDFTAELSGIKALTGLDAAAMDEVKAKAMELGDATKFSSTEAAQGMAELLKAGVSTKDVLGEASQAALNLASAGDLGMADAAEIMSTAMNAFHTDDATHAADILAGAANASATSVQELRYSLAACSAVAAGAGMSFDDTNTALAVFAQNGLKGSDAGTSLKTMLQNLIPTSKEQYEAFRQLNLLTEDGTSAFFDQAGNMKDLASIAGLLQDRMKGLTKEQKLSYLNTMFGSDAIRGGMILLREGANGVKNMYAEMSKYTVAEVAAEKNNNLRGSLDELSSAWENFTIKLLDGKAGNGLRDFVDELTGLVRGFNGLLSDGLQVSDVLKTLGKGFVDLKNKALAMDGVGSVLAGGALVVGLGKIISLAMKASDWLKKVASTPIGSTGPKPNGGLGGKGIGDMVVNAKTVIVNGNAPGTPGTAPTGTPTKPGKTTPSTTPSRFGRVGRWLGRLGLPLTLASGALDIAYAPEDQRGQAIGGTIGSTAGWLLGAKGGALAGAALGSVVPGIGTAVGAGVGGLVGGVAGSMLGGSAGQHIGGLNWDNEVAYVTQKFNDIGARWDDLQVRQQAGADATKARLAQNNDEWYQNTVTCFDGVRQFASGCWDTMTQMIAEKNQQWSSDFASAKDAAGQALNGLGQWAQGVWDAISSGADSLASSIGSAFDNAASWAKNAWDGVTDWFDANIWGPLKERASNAWADINVKASSIQLPSLSSIGTSIYDYVTGHATGATSFAGGWTEINERGGELIDLPSGSRIYPHATTVNMLEKQFSQVGNSIAPQVTITGNTFTVREEADIDRIAYQLMRLMQQANTNFGGGYGWA